MTGVAKVPAACDPVRTRARLDAVLQLGRRQATRASRQSPHVNRIRNLQNPSWHLDGAQETKFGTGFDFRPLSPTARAPAPAQDEIVSSIAPKTSASATAL